MVVVLLSSYSVELKTHFLHSLFISKTPKMITSRAQAGITEKRGGAPPAGRRRGRYKCRFTEMLLKEKFRGLKDARTVSNDQFS